MWVVTLIAFRYYLNRENIVVLEGVVVSGGEVGRTNNLEETKNLLFAFFDDVKVIVERQSKFLLHWALHFFVIVLGFISDLFDYLYSKARDLLLQTATKEREVVAKFWHHLKEYKKEQDLK